MIALIALVCAMALTACGGGSGGSSDSRPVADAGPDQIVETGTLVTLDGSDSYDRKGEELTYRWDFTSWPNDSDPELSDVNAPNPTFTPDFHGNYVLSLVVNNGVEDSAPDSVTITSAPLPVAHWAFEEGTGTTATDSAGSHHGTLMGPPTWVEGAVGNYALEFGGTNDYVRVPHAPVFNAEVFAISFWLYSINDNETRAIIRRAGGWHVRKVPRTHELQFCVEEVGNDPLCLGSGYRLPDRQWHRYDVVVENGSAATFYVDGNSYRIILASVHP